MAAADSAGERPVAGKEGVVTREKRSMLPTRYEMEQTIEKLKAQCAFLEKVAENYKALATRWAAIEPPSPIIITKCPKCGWDLREMVDEQK